MCKSQKDYCIQCLVIVAYEKVYYENVRVLKQNMKVALDNTVVPRKFKARAY